MLTVLLSRNDERISDTLLDIINPVKQSYKNFTHNLEDKSHSYIFQKESIEKLSKENRILRKRLLEQIHYIEQVKNIYDTLPALSRLPIPNISITETISYVKLNSFTQIILTKPKDLEENRLYGLIQGRVVAGIASVSSKQLYGYLTSDKKCRFSVFIGESKAPGIALGKNQNEMIVKFIPKWYKIKEGDVVVTSGLDAIFFADVPVGVVTKIEVRSAYTVAHIKTYSDIFHPKTFFLINDARATLADNFDSNLTNVEIHCAKPENNVTLIDQNASITEQNGTITAEHNITFSMPVVSSIPSRIDQTQEDVVTPEAVEETVVPPVAPPKKKPKRKRKPRPSTLDLF
jgi:rod shape-determining protein MreC